MFFYCYVFNVWVILQCYFYIMFWGINYKVINKFQCIWVYGGSLVVIYGDDCVIRQVIEGSLKVGFIDEGNVFVQGNFDLFVGLFVDYFFVIVVVRCFVICMKNEEYVYYYIDGNIDQQVC